MLLENGRGKFRSKEMPWCSDKWCISDCNIDSETDINTASRQKFAFIPLPSFWDRLHSHQRTHCLKNAQWIVDCVDYVTTQEWWVVSFNDLSCDLINFLYFWTPWTSGWWHLKDRLFINVHAKIQFSGAFNYSCTVSNWCFIYFFLFWQLLEKIVIENYSSWVKWKVWPQIQVFNAFKEAAEHFLIFFTLKYSFWESRDILKESRFRKQNSEKVRYLTTKRSSEGAQKVWLF